MTLMTKILHQIWIGPHKKPDIWMKTFSKDYIKLNPHWEYKLWNDDNISELFENFPLMKKIYDLEPTYNGKSDLLRYLILFKYGGIYIDADSVWINNKSFDILLDEINKYSIFVAYQKEDVYKDLLCGGVMGSSKNNKYIKHLINRVENMIKRSWKDNKIYPQDYIRKCVMHGAWKRIGPGLITREFKDNNEILKLPSIYFYPIDFLNGEQKINYHETLDLPKESYTFQYGYTSNNMQENINNI